MTNQIIVVGKNNSLSNSFAEILQNLQFTYEYLSAREIVISFQKRTDEGRIKLLNDKLTAFEKNKIGVILLHRIRNKDIKEAIENEILLSRDFIVCLSHIFEKLNVIYISSVTGSLFDKNSDESYHYTKDLQKSICRYLSMKIPKITANILQLSAYKKYNEEDWNDEYKCIYNEYTRKMCEIPVIQKDQIALTAVNLVINNFGFRGAIIPLDNGYQLVQ